MHRWEYFTLTAAYSSGDGLGIVKMYGDQELPDWKNKKSGVAQALASLGDQGWELVTVIWRVTGESSHADPVYYFKRPKD